MFRKILVAATAVAFVVMVVGAFVRLSDAGLGCPDWPGCYGRSSATQAAEDISKAESLNPQGPVTLVKAWKEMGHRYLALILGVLLLALAVYACLEREELHQSPALPLLLVVFVAFQASLGMWTVTLLLKPAIVSAHLLGGMITWCLLVWINLRQGRLADVRELAVARRLRWWALFAFLIVFVQVALGGWVSTNYAALACPDFPTCHGSLFPAMDFHHSFQLQRELGRTEQGALLTNENLVAIHWTHRLGALIVLAVVGGLALTLMGSRDWRPYGWGVALVLVLQVGLGIANVVLSLPLPIAVTHNGGAALLLAALLMLNYQLWHADR